jgi:arsenate reductase
MLNRAGGGKFRAFSAGSDPRGEVNPHAVALLRELGYPTAGLRSKSWDEFAVEGAPALDFIFTVCDNAAAEACPAWPGRPITAHWGLPDPAAADAAHITRAFAETYKELRERIAAFAALPLESLERLALQQKLDRIGGHAP